MAIFLPTSPQAQSAKPSLIKFGGDLTPSLGGPVQRIVRIGSRFQVQVTLPPLTSTQLKLWLAARLAAEAQASTMVFAFPEQDAVNLGAGAVVNGGGQVGAVLPIRGATANLAIPANSFFTILTGGRRYLHSTTAAATVSSGGTATLSIGPRLRVAPSDGAQIISAPAQIEGFDDPSTIDWTEQLDRTGELSFTLTEAA